MGQISAPRILLLPKLPVLTFAVFFSLASHAQQNQSKVWVSDLQNGMYKNPVIHSDYSDPDVIRVGPDYYMVSSSFNCIPGLPILHSFDLVNWKIINYALTKQGPDTIYDLPQHGKGVWAPCIRYNKGEFFIYYPDPDFGIYMIKTKNPNGKWSKPKLVLAGKGIIDPSPFWDSYGKVFLAVAWAGSRAGVNSLITIFRMNSQGTKVLDKGRHVYDGHDTNPTIEGPKLYKRNGYYYIFAPAGGVATGWQVVLRSRNIYGPYEQKTVLAQGKTDINGPHQGALVETPREDSWFIHFQDRGPYGRVVLLEPVKWKDHWPIIGEDKDGDGIGEPIHIFNKPAVGRQFPILNPSEDDEFNDGKPGLQWQWQANENIAWAAMIRGTGNLRLFAYPSAKGDDNLWNVPNLLLQKFPAPEFTATCKLQYHVEWDVWKGKRAGMIIMGNDYAGICISKDEKGFKITQTICRDASKGTVETVVDEHYISSPVAYLQIKVSAPNAKCRFQFSEDGTLFRPIGGEFFAKPDKWVGAKIGLFSTSAPDVRLGGYCDFDWFRVTP